MKAYVLVVSKDAQKVKRENLSDFTDMEELTGPYDLLVTIHKPSMKDFSLAFNSLRSRDSVERIVPCIVLDS